jgi:NAD(P)H-hydrate epimerase
MGNRKLSPFTTEGMLSLENLACTKYGVTVDQMMQKAGQSLHDFVVGELPDVKKVLVLAGKGNNGGDALVAGDRLLASGYEVTSMRVEAAFEDDFDFSQFDLIIDGLFGFSLKGNPRPPMNTIIEQINCSKVPILAVDVPSGLEVYTGKVMKPTVKATYTLALGMLKKGLKENRGYAGEVYLGNLGIPAEAYTEKMLDPPDFSGGNYFLIGD